MEEKEWFSMRKQHSSVSSVIVWSLYFKMYHRCCCGSDRKASLPRRSTATVRETLEPLA